MSCEKKSTDEVDLAPGAVASGVDKPSLEERLRPRALSDINIGGPGRINCSSGSFPFPMQVVGGLTMMQRKNIVKQATIRNM